MVVLTNLVDIFGLFEAPNEWRGSAEDQLTIIYGDQPNIGTRLSGV